MSVSDIDYDKVLNCDHSFYYTGETKNGVIGLANVIKCKHCDIETLCFSSEQKEKYAVYSPKVEMGGII
jgi:hypothetical protein